MKLTYKNGYEARKFNILLKRVEKFYNKKELRIVLKLLKNEKILKFNNIQISELFLRRGTTYYELKEYNNALTDFKTALKYNPKYAQAYYNIGTIFVSIKRNYDEALKYFELARKFNIKMTSAHVSIASIYRFRKDYTKALETLNNAIEIDSNDANAFYNRGVAKMESYLNWNDAINDFRKFIELTSLHDSWVSYATYYVSYMEDRLKNDYLYNINKCISKIKNCLSISDKYITHYTGVSTLKILIFDESNFRLSEGNFLNDPSEGSELFNFLDPENLLFSKDSLERIHVKPFIGSFVLSSNNDDLNLFRFYGKDKGIDAKGCSITINKFDFLNSLIDSIDIDDEGYNSLKDNIDFYYVSYFNKNDDSFTFSGQKDNNSLNKLMQELKKLVKKCNLTDDREKLTLEQDLLSIAFLFKNKIYENEQEIRILTNGESFEKKFDLDLLPPRIYIELIPLKNFIKHIQFGPKVDNFVDWNTSIYYAYNRKPPSLGLSKLPYK